MTEIERLAELSEKATQGEWAIKCALHSGDCALVVPDIVPDERGPAIIAECFADIRKANERSDGEAQANANFIAALVNWFRANLSILQGESVQEGFVHTAPDPLNRTICGTAVTYAERGEPREAMLEEAPRWYTRQEIVDVLQGMKYSPEIAQELADWLLHHLQLAFNKGHQLGQQIAVRALQAPPSPKSDSHCAKRHKDCWPCLTCGAAQPSECKNP